MGRVIRMAQPSDDQRTFFLGTVFNPIVIDFGQTIHIAIITVAHIPPKAPQAQFLLNACRNY